jgi:hypothetical protein
VIKLDDYRRRRSGPLDPIPTADEEPGPSLPPAVSDLRWKLSQRGNPYAVVNKAFHIVVFRRAGAWAFRIADLNTGQARFSKRRYGTKDAARADDLLAVNQLQGKQPERKA